MKKILLFTADNDFYEGSLNKRGFATISADLSFVQGKLLKFKKVDSFDYVIYENYLNDLDFTQEFLNFLAKARKEVIFLTNEISPDERKNLLSFGIIDVLPPRNIEKIILTVKFKVESIKNVKGQFIILDDNQVIRNNLERIINRFNYKSFFVDSVDDVFSHLKQPDIHFVFLNLGFSGLNLNDLLKKSYAYSEIKKIPFIVYKDMDLGLFVNEIVSGLNKLTKVILSPEELYSFLIDLIYKKELVALVEKLKEDSYPATYSFFRDKNLNQIYFSEGEKLFSSENILLTENTDRIIYLTNFIRDIVFRVESLKWLRKENQSEDIKTCGFHG